MWSQVWRLWRRCHQLALATVSRGTTYRGFPPLLKCQRRTRPSPTAIALIPQSPLHVVHCDRRLEAHGAHLPALARAGRLGAPARSHLPPRPGHAVAQPEPLPCVVDHAEAQAYPLSRAQRHPRAHSDPLSLGEAQCPTLRRFRGHRRARAPSAPPPSVLGGPSAARSSVLRLAGGHSSDCGCDCAAEPHSLPLSALRSAASLCSAPLRPLEEALPLSPSALHCAALAQHQLQREGRARAEGLRWRPSALPASAALSRTCLSRNGSRSRCGS